MARYEYMNIPLPWFPQDIIDQYKIMDLVDKGGFVHVDIRKGMCGINQEARIAYDCPYSKTTETSWILSTPLQPWHLVPRNDPN